MALGTSPLQLSDFSSLPPRLTLRAGFRLLPQPLRIQQPLSDSCCWGTSVPPPGTILQNPRQTHPSLFSLNPQLVPDKHLCPPALTDTRRAGEPHPRQLPPSCRHRSNRLPCVCQPQGTWRAHGSPFLRHGSKASPRSRDRALNLFARSSLFPLGPVSLS